MLVVQVLQRSQLQSKSSLIGILNLQHLVYYIGSIAQISGGGVSTPPTSRKF